MPVEDVRPDGRSPNSPIRNPGLHSRASSPRDAKQNATDVAYYVDTSALAKLVVAEPETDALEAWFAQIERNPVSSDLARTELLRTVRRVAPELVVRARDVLDSVTLIQITTAMFEHAALLDPTMLRSLDALHLSAALGLGDDLEGLVTYDDRLAHAATANGIRVTAPT